ncbi:MAG TPA: glycoside hydrolase domain-containing protein [Gemmatimonadaceae bacterium]|nr:glycoside hydrolase domain-containing protein [Gemmatimonadaceae bacterium]
MEAPSMLKDWYRSPRVRAILLTGAALITAVLAVPTMQEPTTGLGDTLTEAPMRLATAVERAIDQQYLGFDTNIYPGDRTMNIWAKDGTYDWVGYYLPAPCHRDQTWSGKRDTLISMGWGLAVVYVGQQVWKTSKKPKKGATCSNSFIGGGRGVAEGHDAIAKVVAEGFPHGTVIFLDIERMDAIPEKMKAYYRSWTQTVLDDGRYRVGYYTHVDNAEEIYQDVKSIFLAKGDTTHPPFWIAGRTKIFTVDKMPTDVGHTFAAVWQGLLDVTRTHKGIRLPVDINVSGSRSPSEVNASP